MDKIDKSNIKEYNEVPSYQRLSNMDRLKNWGDDNYKIVRFALNDEGDNAIALLDLRKKKIISYSITGASEIKQIEKLSNK